MKLNKQSLRKLVLEEMAQVRRPRRPSLVSLIFEDVGQDIEKAFKGGPAAVRSLANSAKDKEELKNALKGDYDGEANDDVVKVAPGQSPAVKDLLPTQSEIDLVKSIGWPLGDLKTLEKMIQTGTSTAPGSITISGNLVLDGHHRWSSVWGISGPGGTVKADDLNIPGSTSEKLAAAQLAIAAYKEPSAAQPTADDPIALNILGKDSAGIEKDILAAEGQKDPDAPGAILNPEYLDGCSKSETVAKWAGFSVGDDVAKVKDAIVKKVASNLAGLPKNPDAPARADMPQFDAKSIGGKKAKADMFASMQKGDYNIEPPFKPESGEKQTAGFKRDGQIVVERWQRLAGIVKG